jgi:hypothetical protein
MVHYSWWNIVEKRPFQANAVITNQFGTGRIFLSNVAFLMAPAWKNTDLPGIPAPTHYLCYRASGFLPPQITHDLRDEWRTDGQIADSLVYFCAPCTKLHGTQLYAPADTVTHLALYRLHLQSPVFGPLIKDQFIARTYPVEQIFEEYLAVPSMKTQVVGVDKETPKSDVTMDAPRPNPAQGTATVSFSLPRDMEVRLDVFDISGRRVATLSRGTLSPGEHFVIWDLRDAARNHVRAGVYVMRLAAGGQQLKRLLVVTH